MGWLENEMELQKSPTAGTKLSWDVHMDKKNEKALAKGNLDDKWEG